MERLKEGKVSESSNEPTKQEAMTCTTGSGCEDCHWLDFKRRKITMSAKRRYSTDRGGPHCHHICLWGCEAGKQINTLSLHLYLYGVQFKNPP